MTEFAKKLIGLIDLPKSLPTLVSLSFWDDTRKTFIENL